MARALRHAEAATRLRLVLSELKMLMEDLDANQLLSHNLATARLVQ
jgi:hypothetical protein